MRTSRVVFVLASACLVLSGCASPATEPSPETSVTPAAPPPSSSPSPTATPQRVIDVTPDGLADEGGGAAPVSFEEGNEVVNFIGSVTGSAPTLTDIEDPWGNGTTWGTSYQWDGVRVSLIDGRASIWIESESIAGARFQTAEGVAVGTARAAAMAAGALDDWDDDGDGIADFLRIGTRPVPGTNSLTEPSSVGSEYLLLGLEADVVVQITLGNDFSDI